MVPNASLNVRSDFHLSLSPFQYLERQQCGGMPVIREEGELVGEFPHLLLLAGWFVLL